jgi:hypothetical protein
MKIYANIDTGLRINIKDNENVKEIDITVEKDYSRLVVELKLDESLPDLNLTKQ